MICSLLELGVDAKSLNDAQKAGIEILGDDAEVGQHQGAGVSGGSMMKCWMSP